MKNEFKKPLIETILLDNDLIITDSGDIGFFNKINGVSQNDDEVVNGYHWRG